MSNTDERAQTLAAMAQLQPLPDSRLSVIATPKNSRRMMNGAYWIPIFCASCGADGGMVPEENMRFVSYLCNDCYRKYGNIDGVYIEPDRIFWAKVELEQIEKYGRVLTPEELLSVANAGASPLATLIKEGR